MNRVLWAGLIVMSASVLFYLGYLLTTFLRPMLTGLAVIGGLIFIAGVVLAFRQKGHIKEPSSPVSG
jgi:hypothetical protein